MIADSEKRDAGRSVVDVAEEGFYVVDGGGVEQIGHSFGESSPSHEDHLPRYSAEVISSRRPFHSPHIPPPAATPLLAWLFNLIFFSETFAGLVYVKLKPQLRRRCMSYFLLRGYLIKVEFEKPQNVLF